VRPAQCLPKLNHVQNSDWPFVSTDTGANMTFAGNFKTKSLKYSHV